jgi:hypothetical protein
MSRLLARPTFGRWFRPLFLGTYLGAWGAAAVHALTDPRLAWLPYVGVLKWVLYLTSFTLLAFVWIAGVALYDVILLKLRVRTLPTGPRAWGLSAMAPLVGGVVLRLLPTSAAVAFWPWLAAALVPTLAVAFGARFALGERP